MKITMKKELMNDVLMGLVVAATFAAVVPSDAFAQLSSAVGNARDDVAKPFVGIVSYIAYGIGTVLVVAGIAQAKKHADNPNGVPLGHALGRLGAGAAFLVAPYFLGMLSDTGDDVFGTDTSSLSNIGF